MENFPNQTLIDKSRENFISLNHQLSKGSWMSEQSQDQILAWGYAVIICYDFTFDTRSVLCQCSS